MFKELVSCFIKYRKEKCFLSMQMFETIKKNIENDLIESYELSYNLVNEHSDLFNASSSFFDFLLKLFNIQNFNDSYKNDEKHCPQFKKDCEWYRSNYSKIKTQYDTLDGQHHTLKAEFNTITSKLDSLQANYDQLYSKCDSLKASLKDVTTKYTDSQTELRNVSTQYDRCQKNYEKYQKEYEKCLKEYEDLQSKWTAKYEECQKENIDLHSRLQKFDESTSFIKTEPFDTPSFDHRHYEDLQRQIDILSLDRKKSLIRDSERENFIKTLEEQLQECRETNKHLEMEFENIREYKPSPPEVENAQLTYQLNVATSKHQELQNQYDTLRQNYELLQKHLTEQQIRFTELTEKHQQDIAKLEKTYNTDHKHMIREIISKQQYDNESLQTCHQELVEAKNTILHLQSQLKRAYDDNTNLQHRYQQDYKTFQRFYEQFVLEPIRSETPESQDTPSPQTDNFQKEYLTLMARYKLLKKEKDRIVKRCKNAIKTKDLELSLCKKQHNVIKSQEEMKLYQDNILLSNQLAELKWNYLNPSSTMSEEYENIKKQLEHCIKSSQIKLEEKQKEFNHLDLEFHNYIKTQAENVTSLQEELQRKTTEIHELEKRLQRRDVMKQGQRIRSAEFKTRRLDRRSKTIAAKRHMRSQDATQSLKRVMDDESTTDQQDKKRALEKELPIKQEEKTFKEELPYLDSAYSTQRYEISQLKLLCKCLYVKYFMLYQKYMNKSKLEPDETIENLKLLLQKLSSKKKYEGELVQILFSYIIQEIDTVLGKPIQDVEHMNDIMECLLNCMKKTRQYIEEKYIKEEQ